MNKTYIRYISLVVALGGFLLGFDSAVIAGVNPFIEDYFFMSELELGFSGACVILGAMLGNLFSGIISEKYGRKRTLIFTAVLFTFSAITSALADDFWMFLVARFIGGVGVGGALLIAPIYIAEIAPPDLRGFLVSFNQFNIVLGIFIAFLSNYFLKDLEENSWRWMLGVETFPAMLYFLLLWTVPKSPRWLMSIKNNEEEAKRILMRFGGEHYTEKTLVEIKKGIKEEQSLKRGSLSDLFKKKYNLIMLIAFGLAFFQQITGINAIFYYAPTIFEQAGGGLESTFIQSLIVSVINLFFTIIAMILIDRLGRKPLLLIGSAMMTIALGITSYAFSNRIYTISHEKMTSFESSIKALDDKITILNLDEQSNKAIKRVEMLMIEKKILSKVYSNLKENLGNSFDSQKIFSDVIGKGLSMQELNTMKREVPNKFIVVNAQLILIGILLFVAAFAISLGPIMWALFSEIFPVHIKAIAISVVGFFNSFVSFVVAYLFPWILVNLGPSVTFFIFTTFAALTFVFTWGIVRETKGKTLEDLEKELILN
ncbi:glucose transport protein [Flavobacteriaceae bacterium UJ101]|nr:glucose transport protein [Flavobacteriaceae bacterium UJ101]